jgi:HAMP domain-containing protein
MRSRSNTSDPFGWRKRYSGLGLKLNLRIAAFFVLFWAATCLIILGHELTEIVEKAKGDCEVILTQVDALQSYTWEELRPLMFDLLDDEFVRQAMSSAFIAREVVARFQDSYPDYYFKFATSNPRNGGNLADSTELNIMNEFLADRSRKEWCGIVYRNNERYYLVATPIWFNDSCMVCHGDPADAQRGLVEQYGDTGGFHLQPGDLAIKSIGVPINAKLAQAGMGAAQFSMLAGLFLTGLFFLVTLLLKRLVTTPLDKLNEGAEILGSGELDYRIELKSGDEIEDLANSLNLMADRIQESQLTLEKRVRERTVALKEKVDELEKFNMDMVGREMRMIELKGEVNSLLRQDGLEPRYKTDLEGASVGADIDPLVNRRAAKRHSPPENDFQDSTPAASEVESE